MDGLLVIDKPAGFTSHDVVAKVRRILKTKRVGHTGTLDPFATGVLVVLVGKATRLARFLDKDDKEYDAMVRFGFETDTGDRTGIQNAECKMENEEVAGKLAATDWDAVLAGFRGEIDQIPPMHSAKKVRGKKLYEYAREGKNIERKAEKITISKLETDGRSIESPGHDTWDLRVNVTCSAGTYVRTLAEDIGRAVGTGAHLAELRRTRAGRFSLLQSVTLEELEKSNDHATHLLPLEIAVEHLAIVTLSSMRVEKTKSGLSTRVVDLDLTDGEPARMLDERDHLIAIGFYDAAEGSVRPKIVLV